MQVNTGFNIAIAAAAAVIIPTNNLVVESDNAEIEMPVTLPSPPNICARDMVDHLLNSKKKRPRMPNEFLIYRKALVKELKNRGLKIKMTKLSQLASNSWQRTSNATKSEYRMIAREVEKLYTDALIARQTDEERQKIREYEEAEQREREEKKKKCNSKKNLALTTPKTDKPIIEYPPPHSELPKIDPYFDEFMSLPVEELDPNCFGQVPLTPISSNSSISTPVDIIFDEYPSENILLKDPRLDLYDETYPCFNYMDTSTPFFGYTNTTNTEFLLF